MTLFFSFVIAMFVTMVLIPPLMRWAEQLRFVDFPEPRKVHAAPIPRVGGAAMVVGALLPMLMWLSGDRETVAFLAGMAIIFLFGLWDDRKALDYRIKFLGQLFAIVVAVWPGGVLIELVPFGGPEPLPPHVAVPLTVFALVGITNAINLADGLDGLAGGTTLLSLGAVALLAHMAGDTMVVLVALAVMGSILGFLRFNTYPARVFMGDSGSQLLGYAVGVLVIMLSQRVNTALSPAMPVMLLGLPILDTVMVMGRRMREGRSPFSADRNHIHHRLLSLDFDHYEAVFLIYAAQAALVTGAYFLRYHADSLILGLYGAFCGLVLAFFQWAAHTGWRAHRGRAEGASSFLAGRVQWLRRGRYLSKWPFLLAVATIPVYLILGSALAGRVPADVGLLALGVGAAVLALCCRGGREAFNWVERACAYVTATMVVYLLHAAPGATAPAELFIDAYFIVLAAVVAVGFRFSEDQRFRVTPLDFLVIFIAFTVPNVPGLHIHMPNFGEGVAEMIVLFYAMELVLSHAWHRWDAVRLTLLATLGVLAVRGLLGG